MLLPAAAAVYVMSVMSAEQQSHNQTISNNILPAAGTYPDKKCPKNIDKKAKFGIPKTLKAKHTCILKEYNHKWMELKKKRRYFDDMIGRDKSLHLGK